LVVRSSKGRFGLSVAMRPSSAALVRVAAAGLSFSLGVLAARILDVSDFGVLSLLLAGANIGVVVALLGHEDLASRNASIATATGDARGLEAYRAYTTRNILTAGLVVSTVGVLVYGVSLSGFRSRDWIVLVSFTVILVCAVRTRYAQSLVRGKHYPALALIPDGIVRVGLGLFLLAAIAATEAGSLQAVAVALAAAAVVGLVTALKFERELVPLSPSARETTTQTRRFSPHLYTSSILGILGSQMALLLTGHLAGSTSAAFYAAADRVASATAIAPQALYWAIAPTISRLHTLGDSAGLATVLRRYTRLAAGVTAVMMLAIGLLSAPVLGMFGPAYVSAKYALTILLLATFLSTAAGPTGMVLVMTRHEGLHAAALAVSLSVQLILSLALIPRFGPLGAAGATLVFTLLWNGLMLLAIRQRLGLGPLLAWTQG
jgi:O-antigen/teichoic acid export membrane protein